MKILGIIPARYASMRFPGKPLADIAGKPMIQRVYERAKMAGSLCDVLVATDDERIFDCVKSFGGSVVMTDSDLPNGTARCEQAARLFGEEVDAVINIQGDEPLLDPVMIDEVAELLTDNYCATLCRELCDYADDVAAITQKEDKSPLSKGGFRGGALPTQFRGGALHTRFSGVAENKQPHPSPLLTQERETACGVDNPNTVKVVMSQDGYALYFSRSVIPYKRNKSDIPFYQHIGIYGYSISFLKKYVSLPNTPLSDAESLEQLKILEHGCKIRIKVTSSQHESIGVDTPEDLQRVRAIINAEI